MLKVCFTGHRPDKLGGYDWNTPKNQNIIEALGRKIEELTNNEDETHFICGGALGIDQMAFDICRIFRDQFYGLTIEVAIPFLKQDVKWNFYDGLRWRQQLNAADKITRVDKLENYKIKGYDDDIYYPAKMQKRNEYMVDNSDIIIGVWNGTKGGTANCIKYAQKQGKKIFILNPETLKFQQL